MAIDPAAGPSATTGTVDAVVFDDVILSGDVGLAKPDPAIYELAAKRFGVTPESTLFVDDRADNIVGGDGGRRTHHFTDPAALAPALARVGLPAPSVRKDA